MAINNKNHDNYSLQEIREVCRLCMANNASVPLFPDSNQLKTERELPLVCKIMSTINIQVFISFCSYRSCTFSDCRINPRNGKFLQVYTQSVNKTSV